MQTLMENSNTNPYLFSLVIITATAVFGRLINWIFEKGVRRVVGRTKTQVDDRIFEVLRSPIYWTILLGGIYIALWNLPLTVNINSILNKIIVSAGLVIWGIAGVNFSRILFTQLREKAEHEHQETIENVLPFLNNVVIIGITLLVFLTGLSFWGININPALASAGVVGVAVAFAAKDTVANIFGGISVIFDKPYKSGDYVIIQDKYRGEVIQIGIRSTKIRTRDNVLLTVPNSIMATDAIVNETGFDPELRIRIPLGIAYGTELERAEKILIDVALANPELVRKPKPKVRYRKFADSTIELEVLGVIAKPADRGRIIHELIKAIYSRLKKEKIEMPYPQRDIHLYQEK